MNTEEHKNPNEQIWSGKREDLLRPREQRRGAAFFWYVQGDAAAGGEVEDEA